MSFFIYDIESTGLGDYDKIGICEIACKELNSGEEYHAFVKPSYPIHPDASAINGLTSDILNCCEDWGKVGSYFLNWVEQFPAPYYFMAHNGYYYDHLVLYHESKKHKLLSRFNLSYNFVDSCILMRRLKVSFIGKYSLGSLYEELFHKNIKSQHTAMADVHALITILGYVKNRNTWSSFFEKNMYRMALQNFTHWKWHSNKTITFKRK